MSGTFNRPITVRNLTTPAIYLAKNQVGVDRSLPRVYSQGGVDLADDLAVFMQDTIAIDVETLHGPIRYLTGRVAGVSAGSSPMSLGIASPAELMLDSHVEPVPDDAAQASDILKRIAAEFDIPIKFADPQMEGGLVDLQMAYAADYSASAIGEMSRVATQAAWTLIEQGDGSIFVTMGPTDHRVMPIIRGTPPFVDGSLDLSDKRIRDVYASAVIPPRDKRGKRKAAEMVISTTTSDAGAVVKSKQYYRSRSATTEAALRAEAARIQTNTVSAGFKYTCTMDGVVDAIDNVWQVGQIVTVTDYRCRIANLDLVIVGVKFKQSAVDDQKTTLTLALPGVYYGQSPDEYREGSGKSVFNGVMWWRDV